METNHLGEEIHKCRVHWLGVFYFQTVMLLMIIVITVNVY